MSSFTLDQHRGFIRLKGQDAKTFLQGLITNDVEQVSPEKTIYTALLTPQGRYLFDFFISQQDEDLLLDVDFNRLPDLVSLLKKYKLRSQVDIVAEESPQTVAYVFGEGALAALDLDPSLGFTNRFGYVDPRLVALGARVTLTEQMLQDKGLKRADFDKFEELRLQLGVPLAGPDLIVEKSIPLECGFDELNAIGWEKGCYLGQELTARTKYRGLVRKRLLPVTIKGAAAEPMTPLLFNGEEMGSMRSSYQNQGMALIRLEVLETLGDGYLTTPDAKVIPHVLPWMKFHQ